MAKEEKKQEEKKDKLFILIPQADGKMFNGAVFVSQQRVKIEDGVQTEGEKTDLIRPDGMGIYTVPGNGPNYENRLKAMLGFMERNNVGEVPFIAGPFGDRKEALEKMHEIRPKLPAEEVGELKELGKAKDATIADLKRKLAEAEQKSGK